MSDFKDQYRKSLRGVYNLDQVDLSLSPASRKSLQQDAKVIGGSEFDPRPARLVGDLQGSEEARLNARELPDEYEDSLYVTDSADLIKGLAMTREAKLQGRGEELVSRATPILKKAKQIYESDWAPSNAEEYASYLLKKHGILEPNMMAEAMRDESINVNFVYEAFRILYRGIYSHCYYPLKSGDYTIVNGVNYPRGMEPKMDWVIWPAVNIADLSDVKRKLLIESGWWWWDYGASPFDLMEMTHRDIICTNYSMVDVPDDDDCIRIRGLLAECILDVMNESFGGGGAFNPVSVTMDFLAAVDDRFKRAKAGDMPYRPKRLECYLILSPYRSKVALAFNKRCKTSEFVLTSVTLSMLMKIAKADVRIENVTVRNLKDYAESFGLGDAPEGKYLVAFANDQYIPRWRIGNNTKCGDEFCSKIIFPYRCPSIDWEPECNDENCTGCDLCGGVVRNGFCYHSGAPAESQYPRVLAWTLPSRPGVTLGVHDAYLTEYSRFGAVSVQHGKGSVTHAIDSYSVEALQIHSLVLSVLSFVVAMAGLVLTVLHLNKSHNADVDYDSLDADSVELTGTDDAYISVPARSYARRKKNKDRGSTVPWWPLILLLVFLCLFIPARADFDMSNVMETPGRVVDLNYTVPSTCSCSDPDSLVSQLSCVLPCETEVDIGDRHLGIHFGLNQDCRDMKLIVIKSVHELQCHYCTSGSASKWCYDMRKNCPRETCKVTRATHGPMEHGCAWDGGSVHRLDFSYDIYNAKYCKVMTGSYGGITGLRSGENYSKSIHSTLVAQASYLQVFMPGGMVTYKVANGEIFSRRAFIVNNSDVDDKGLIETSYAYQEIWNMRTRSDCSSCGGVNMTLGLPEFSPTMFDQQCEVEINFEFMRCFSAKVQCNGTYRKSGNHIYYSAYEDSICNGKYTGKNTPTSPPNNMGYGPNCTADIKYENKVPSDECEIKIYFENTANISNFSKHDNDNEILFRFEQIGIGAATVAGSLLGAVLMVILIILAIKFMISCIGSSNK